MLALLGKQKEEMDLKEDFLFLHGSHKLLNGGGAKNWSKLDGENCKYGVMRIQNILYGWWSVASSTKACSRMSFGQCFAGSYDEQCCDKCLSMALLHISLNSSQLEYI